MALEWCDEKNKKKKVVCMLRNACFCLLSDAEDVIYGKQGWSDEQNTTDKIAGFVCSFKLSCWSDILHFEGHF